MCAKTRQKYSCNGFCGSPLRRENAIGGGGRGDGSERVSECGNGTARWPAAEIHLHRVMRLPQHVMGGGGASEWGQAMAWAEVEVEVKSVDVAWLPTPAQHPDPPLMHTLHSRIG